MTANEDGTINLNDQERHVDQMIEARLSRICLAEWQAAQISPSGKKYKTPKQVTYSSAVSDLIALRRLLYSGETAPQDIAAHLHCGEIQEAFLKHSPYK